MRTLAGDLGINMHTVNKAYAVLRDEGYITMRGRRGARIADSIRATTPAREREHREQAAVELARIATELKARGGSREEFLALATARADRIFFLERMVSKMTGIVVASVCMVALVAVILAIYNRLPAQVPTHAGFDGTVTGYAPKSLRAALFPLWSGFVGTVFALCHGAIPRATHEMPYVVAHSVHLSAQTFLHGPRLKGELHQSIDACGVRCIAGIGDGIDGGCLDFPDGPLELCHRAACDDHLCIAHGFGHPNACPSGETARHEPSRLDPREGGLQARPHAGAQPQPEHRNALANTRISGLRSCVETDAPTGRARRGEP